MKGTTLDVVVINHQLKERIAALEAELAAAKAENATLRRLAKAALKQGMVDCEALRAHLEKST